MHGASTVLDRLEVIYQRWPRDVANLQKEIRAVKDVRDDLLVLYGMTANR